MTGYQTIIFDIGNVIVRWSPEEIIRLTLGDAGDAHAHANQIFQSDIWQALNRGTLTEAQAKQRFADDTALSPAQLETLSAAHTEREKLKSQSKPMFYGNKLYPSARHLLLANPDLVAGGDLGKAVTSLNDKARRAKNQGEVRNLSLDRVGAEYDLAKIGFADEFDGFVAQLVELVGEVALTELFYELKLRTLLS
ncbi:hypothetical protein [Salinivibrio sp. VYel1]|uniref:hypothetical protein n=1 Tax=Salinivibrio sp. VYel1 TaxID=2490490 RepID=UPI001D137FEE|nr:hypothetical protein [Salinivibrio sp. VYel1]